MVQQQNNLIDSYKSKEIKYINNGLNTELLAKPNKLIKLESVSELLNYTSYVSKIMTQM